MSRSISHWRSALSFRAVSSLALPAALLVGCGGGATSTTSALSDVRAADSQTFEYNGGVQTFTVPSHVTQIRVTAQGAGTSSSRGGLVQAKIGVRPGDVLTIVVGGAPHGYKGGYNGGGPGGVCGIHGPCPLRAEGGAGASDVREGGSAIRDRVLVAAGAGGNGGMGQFSGGFGGEGGGVFGGLGDNGVGVNTPSNGVVGGGGGGGGALAHAGGRGGAAGKAGSDKIVPGNRGAAGVAGNGGAGGDSAGSELAGGSGGGGGGGYFGGGGGGSGANGNAKDRFGRNVGSGGGGGGGSSFVVARALNIDIETGDGSDSNGLVVIAW